MELVHLKQSFIRSLLERELYEAAYKESNLSWHPVDTNISIEKIVEQTDEKFMDDVRLFYSTNQQAIFDQLDPVHSSMFLRHIQYEFQINKTRNIYLNILRETIELSIHKGYMFTINLSKQIESDKDPTRKTTAIDIEPTALQITKIIEEMKDKVVKTMLVPSRLITGTVKPNAALYTDIDMKGEADE